MSPLIRTLQLAVVASLAWSGIAHAQTQPIPTNWPDKPIRFIVPYPPGGNADAIARFVADRLGSALKQSVIVDNRAGAGGTIGAELAARSAPDGYTFIVAPTAVLAITPHLRNVRYDPLVDLTPIAQLTGSYSIATARKDAPFNTVQELFVAARKSPGKYTFGSAGPATATHLAGEMIKFNAGIDLLHVPYKGSADSLTDLMGGRIDMIFDPVSLAQVKAGKVKAIAVLSKTRHPELPDVPTLKEQGVDIDTRSWFGLFAPKGIPKDIVQRMAVAVENVLAAQDVRDQLLKVSQYPEFVGPDAFHKQIREDSVFFKDLIKQANITVQ
jgi:tripartite-type tricarboxylate transporter receptor subunit TctC